MSDDSYSREQRWRQVLYWRMFAATFRHHDLSPTLNRMHEDVLEELGLPEVLSHPAAGISTIVQRYPELEDEIENLLEDAEAAAEDNGDIDEDALRRAALYAKLLLNVFNPVPGHNTPVSADEYSQWGEDVGYFERACGLQPGELRDQERGASGEGGTGAGQGSGGGAGVGFSEEEMRRRLGATEDDLIERMELIELLEDDELAEEISPSMTVVEQILRDKNHLSDEAMERAKALVREYVEDVAEAMKITIEKTETGETDDSVPPKRTFRNLDIRRTVWENLVNWDPDDEKLYVDDLYFERNAEKTRPANIVVVMDQSGSMADSMVHCTILASIFAGMPHVDAHLIAYDTQAIDLSDYVDNPLDALLRTQLGGGTEGLRAIPLVEQKIREPSQTAVVWISDFYDFDREALFDRLEDINDSGAHLLPVGSITSSGYQSVDSWFKQQFDTLGTPLISGRIETLIKEIKEVVS